MNNLKTLMEAHKKLKFPDFPVNEDFSDWVADLAELDGYYMGLLTSFEGGNRVFINKTALNKSEKSLMKFASLNEDREIYEKCAIFLKSIRDMMDEAYPERN